MNKIRVIDLLNKIAKGEEVPKEIRYKGEKYIFYGVNYTTPSEHIALHRRIELNKLNDEVEIIEEKEIEKLKLNDSDVWTGKSDGELIVEKINELIDVINDMRDKE